MGTRTPWPVLASVTERYYTQFRYQFKLKDEPTTAPIDNRSKRQKRKDRRRGGGQTTESTQSTESEPIGTTEINDSTEKEKELINPTTSNESDDLHTHTQTGDLIMSTSTSTSTSTSSSESAAELHCQQYVHVHSNGLCVVGIAPEHFLVTSSRTISRIEWLVTAGTVEGKDGEGDSKQGEIQVSGKRKKGGVWCEYPHSTLCRVWCTDGTCTDVRAGLHGKVIQINPRLRMEPDLALKDGTGQGWLAILLIKKRELHDLLQTKPNSGQGNFRHLTLFKHRLETD